jgi:hypothetical protein
MKILVATKETQKQRESDFFWTEEGEIVRVPFECDRDRGDIDGPCGCLRSLTGCKTQRGTTTMKVEDREIKIEDYIEVVRQSFTEAGWYKMMSRKAAEDHILEDVKYLLEAASKFAPGTIVEKRSYKVQERKAG